MSATAPLADARNRHLAPVAEECFLRVPRWRISLSWPLGNDGKPIAMTISAYSAKSAWRKFCKKYFGALKPSPTDYTVELAQERILGEEYHSRCHICYEPGTGPGECERHLPSTD